MAPTVDLRRPGWKKLSPSPRHLVFRHSRRQLRQLRLASDGSEAPPVGPALSAGQEQLFSSYVPGLEAGLHSINVTQNISVTGQQPLIPSTTHAFNVIAPRFQLPENAVNSIYPPQGHADLSEVVPHMVFNDPTLPWERIASDVTGTDSATNTVPWLAVLLFTEDELRLSSSVLESNFPKTSTGATATQSGTFTITLPASEIPNVKNTASAIIYDSDSDGADATTDVIALQANLFNALFTEYDGSGQPTAGQKNGWVRHHRFLAHLRHIHLDGTAAAATTDDDDHAYSVVVSHRTGPMEIKRPTTVVAHLVNIEGVESMSWPVSQDYVAMSSLYSWSYTCLPPNSLNVAEAFENLGSGLSVLCPELTKTDKAKLQAGGKVGSRLQTRLTDGFSMLRYRLQTGEVSAAFFRGPFTPTVVTFPTSEVPPWPATSTTGTQLQILDAQLNMMDLTYSAAWNLGKTLALADQTFAAALSRVRTQIMDEALKEAQLAAVKAWAADLGVPTPYKTKEEVISTLAQAVDALGALPASGRLGKHPKGMAHRWFRPEYPKLDLTYKGDQVDGIIDDYLATAAALIASTTDAGLGPYNEFNVPYSPDWAIVLKWVMDRFFLVNVPPHYLITDPSVLPPESLRFFNIDPAWIWAMVDGGLSLANHIDRDDDRLRDAMKGAINTYLSTTNPILGYAPPVPTFGFYVRSALITKFPDMIVDLVGTDKTETSGPPEILRHEVVGPETLLGLLRTPPVESAFTSLLLREPPHQQYFSAALFIDPKRIQMEYQRVYTDSAANDPDHADSIAYNMTRGSPDPTRGVNFIWGTNSTANDLRILNVENFASDVHTQLVNLFQTDHPTWYQEPYPSAALMGIQLNEPCWQLQVYLSQTSSPSSPATSKPTTTPTAAASTPAIQPTVPNAAVLLPLPQKPARQPRSKATLPPHPPITVAPHPPFGTRTRQRPAHMPPRHSAPHIRAPRPSSTLNSQTTTSSSSNPVVGSDPSSLPKFNYALYPVSAATSSNTSQVPMLTLRQDLIFSITLTPETGQSFQLVSLEFQLPLTPPRPLLRNKYSGGGGATMLSNMRFNVLPTFSADGSSLNLTVVPRSVEGSWPVAYITELSFMLSGVEMWQFAQNTSVNIGVTENYINGQSYPIQDFNVDLVVPGQSASSSPSIAGLALAGEAEEDEEADDTDSDEEESEGEDEDDDEEEVSSSSDEA